MSDKKDDGEKFHEIKEDSFDDMNNSYFSFHDDEDQDDFPSFFEDGELMQEFSEILTSLFDEFVSLLPVDIQEYAEHAVEAVLSRFGMEPEETLKIAKKLRKLAGNLDCPGIYLIEADAYKKIATMNMGKEDEAFRKAIEKEEKALHQYITHFEKKGYGDVEGYLFARVESMRIRQLLGNRKGIFSASLFLPEDADFDMEAIIDSLEEFYSSEEAPDNYDERTYTFTTDSNSVVHLEYNSGEFLDDLLTSIPLSEEEKQKLYGSPFASPHVTVSVDAGKDITAAAIDLQQVLSAIYNVYPDMEDAVLNGISLGKTALPILLEDTREVIFSEHVLFNIFFESEDERYLATHNAEPWGRKNLAVDVKEFDREEDALGVLVDAMYKHIKHAIKPGDHIECYGYDMKASAFNSEISDIIILRERKNG